MKKIIDKDYLLQHGQRGYKVVVVNNDSKKFSYFMYGSSASRCVYGADTVTIPNPECGPLSYFDNIINATDFITNYNTGLLNVELWECLVIPDTRKSLWYTFISAGRKIRKKKSKFLPQGTCFARAIILWKKEQCYRSLFNYILTVDCRVQ